MQLTPAELSAEVRYRYEERLGILCGANQPTPEQIELARKEAEEWREGQRRWEQKELI